MKADIFIRSYAGDFEWLSYCLRSIKKYGNGFGEVHIAVPINDIGSVPVLGGEEVHGVTDRTDGYMAQQITKLHADEFCTAEYVLHVDSDCIFTKDFSPLDFFLDAKPVLLKEECESIWRDITEKHLGWHDKSEYMRRLPIIYPRWMYKPFRDWMQKKHNMSVSDYVIQQSGREFSEFNTFGQWAYKFYPDAFSWLQPHELPIVAIQHWSWGGISGEIRDKMDIILAD